MLETTIRVAVITGASQGIGRRTGEVLAGKRYALALNVIQSTQGTLDAIRQIGAEAIEVLGDVSSETDVDRIAQTVQQHYGRVDLLVNNAGISFIRPAEDTGAEEWRRVLEVNLAGPYAAISADARCLPVSHSRRMRGRDTGSDAGSGVSHMPRLRASVKGRKSGD